MNTKWKGGRGNDEKNPKSQIFNTYAIADKRRLKIVLFFTLLKTGQRSPRFDFLGPKQSRNYFLSLEHTTNMLNACKTIVSDIKGQIHTSRVGKSVIRVRHTQVSSNSGTRGKGGRGNSIIVSVYGIIAGYAVFVIRYCQGIGHRDGEGHRIIVDIKVM